MDSGQDEQIFDLSTLSRLAMHIQRALAEKRLAFPCASTNLCLHLMLVSGKLRILQLCLDWKHKIHDSSSVYLQINTIHRTPYNPRIVKVHRLPQGRSGSCFRAYGLVGASGYRLVWVWPPEYLTYAKNQRRICNPLLVSAVARSIDDETKIKQTSYANAAACDSSNTRHICSVYTYMCICIYTPANYRLPLIISVKPHAQG